MKEGMEERMVEGREERRRGRRVEKRLLVETQYELTGCLEAQSEFSFISVDSNTYRDYYLFRYNHYNVDNYGHMIT